MYRARHNPAFSQFFFNGGRQILGAAKEHLVKRSHPLLALLGVARAPRRALAGQVRVCARSILLIVPSTEPDPASGSR